MTQFLSFLGSFPLSKPRMRGGGGECPRGKSAGNVTAYCLRTQRQSARDCVAEKKTQKRMIILFLDFMTPQNGCCTVALIHLDSGQFNPYSYRDHQSTCNPQLKGCLTATLQYPCSCEHCTILHVHNLVALWRETKIITTSTFTLAPISGQH